MLNYAETTSVRTIVPVQSVSCPESKEHTLTHQTPMSIAQKLHREGNHVIATHVGDDQWKITSKDGTLSPTIVTDAQITAIICHTADRRLEKVK